MIKKLLVASAIFLATLTPVLALAAENGTQICTPNQTAAASGTNLGSCINSIYIFAIGFAGFVALIMFIAAGYMYMTGGESGVKKGKDIMTSTVVALVILFGAFALLNTLDPNLTSIRGVVLPDVSCGTGGCGIGIGPGGNGPGTGGGAAGGGCTPIATGTSPASASSLQSSCFGANANNASIIANRESGGNPVAVSGVDICADGSPASFGLFQINISANKVAGLDCPSAFSRPLTGSNRSCTVTNQGLYNQCVAAADNSALNIQTACALSNNGANWGPWQNSANACGL